MKKYIITAFNKSGELMLNEKFSSENNRTAIKMAKKILEEKKLLTETYRCSTSDGELILFN